MPPKKARTASAKGNKLTIDEVAASLKRLEKAMSAVAVSGTTSASKSKTSPGERVV